jgi:proteasome assembly chaperone (PAC2) family protein
MTELDKRVEDTEKIIKSIESQASREGLGQMNMPQPSNKNLEYIS